MTEDVDALKAHWESEAHKFRNKITNLREAMRTMQEEVTDHRMAHVRIVKWLKDHEPEVYKRAQRELAFGIGEDI